MKRLKLVVILLFTSCSTTYVVTLQDGSKGFFVDRDKALEFHDRNNYNDPLSAEIDSVKRVRFSH